MDFEKIPFDESEMKVVDTVYARSLRMDLNMYDTPITETENSIRSLLGKPAWQMLGHEVRIFTPYIVPDNIARGFVLENRKFSNDTDAGGLDMFGIKWVYVPAALGSMEDPDEPPILDDIFDWREVIKFPNVDEWDWEGSAAANNDTYLTENTYNRVWIMTGWFERLISFMGFEEAAVCMALEDEREEVKELFDALSTLYIDLIDHYVKYYKHIHGFYVHDDWGSAQNSFFSPEVGAEVIVPAMRRVTDHIHELGLVAELHSCGANMKNVPNMIAAGWDSWIPQQNVNDVPEIYRLYGDQIVLGVEPVHFDPATTTEEEQREFARAYAEQYCNPDKPTIYCYTNGAGPLVTPAFWEELYKQSRIRYNS